MSLSAVIIIAALIYVVACWVVDVRRREIPNALSAAAFSVGILLNLASGGGWGVASSLAGATVGIAFLLGPFALGGIGGGDVKMMGAMGALLGPMLVLNALAWGFVLGGVVMIVHLIRIGRLQEKLGSTVRAVYGAAQGMSLAPLRLSDEDVAAVTLPYSVPLGLGTIVVLLPQVGALGPFL